MTQAGYAEGETAYSPVYLVVETVRRYLSLAATHAEVIKAGRRCALPLDQFANQLPEEHPLLGVIDEILDALDELEAHPPDELTLGRLEALELRLVAHDLAELYSAIEVQEERGRVLRGLSQEISEEELSCGHYRVLEGQLRRVFVLHEELEPLLELLSEHEERIKQSLQTYEETYLDAQEWTVEVALADEYMLRGLEMWRQALRDLSVASHNEDGETAFAALATLLQANRELIMVERIAKATTSPRQNRALS